MNISCRMYNGKRGTSYLGVYWKHDASVGDIDMAGLAAALQKKPHPSNVAIWMT